MSRAADKAESEEQADVVIDADPLEHLLLKRRLENLRSGAAVATAPSLASILTLFWTFWNDAPQTALLLWAAIQFIPLTAFALIDRKTDIDTASLPELRLHWKRVHVLQYIGTAIWASIFPFLAMYAEGMEIAVLGVCGTAILAGAQLVHRCDPGAAYFHTAALSAGLLAGALMLGGPGGIPAALLIASFAAALVVAIGRQERAFVSAAEAEIERREKTSVIRMLLNDYEEQSSEWLWTVGPRGNLRDVSVRFAEALDMPCEELEGAPLLSQFQPGEDRDILAEKLACREAFRDLSLRLRVRSELKHWRVSARPREDGRMSGVARDVTADKLIEDRVSFMAHYDNLTGLANRYLFNERLRALTGEQSSSGSSIALFYLDLDDFKAINDTRGHLVGDRLLREVGTRLEQEVRSEDLVARLGGDEFAVLIQTRAGDGLLIERAHRFLAAIRAPYEMDGRSYRVSTSVGVARCVDGDCEAEELMRRADLALYAAKAKGRDNLALFEPELDREAREKRKIENDLGDALAKGQMHMRYQPVVDLDTGETTGFEALLRWHHPERGLIGPGQFLHVAEETGMILALGEWVIRQSLSDVAAMPGNLRIAINLSATQVKNPNLVATVAQAIHATNIAPERVELEITEHVLIDESGAGHATLLRLRELGVRIALDDFGTGYSSLGYLRRFPFDRIKIDRSFVTDIATDIGSQAIVSTLTRLADALGMDTTAEGIEEAGQLELLRKLGVHEAQGYFISRPLPPGDLFETHDGMNGTQGESSVRVAQALEDYREKRRAGGGAARVKHDS